ncbi:bifunctional 2-polyprenyl-6-hydroxyphenol methylase/3-demethylubiquinol 3-O-methyltransferase UbiG [Exiguobacterium sp. SL-9]|uniref:class I SAM-dependent methyltransferase n=1 Tax=Exiguobacterium sp. SL-9 TaxID=2510963 RepID=UPI00103A7AFF|nr:class I SAM-dependent methyltransferase [Exiguobacterium sp. SL-9]TCI20570.1 class I SAM-dependent methyltransferase [Exiguobacterium sp. SL-9]
MSTWDKRFNTDEYVYGENPNAFVKQQAHLFKQGMRVLAIAEGEGRNAVWLAEQGVDVDMWDYSQVGLDKANRLAKRSGVTLHTHLVDLVDADWPEDAYDAIICIYGHFPNHVKKSVVAGVNRALKPGGYFVTEVYSEAQLAYGTGGPKQKELLYTPADFASLMDSFKTIHFFDGTVERHEGALHNGESAVLQYIGQKHH